VREYVYAYAAVAPARAPNGLTDFARNLNNHDESLSGAGEPNLSHALYCHARRVLRAGIAPKNYVSQQIFGWFRSLPAALILYPVEHVWDELREKCFHNRVFSSLDGVIEMLCQGLIDLADDPQRLHSLTSFPHLNVLH